MIVSCDYEQRTESVKKKEVKKLGHWLLRLFGLFYQLAAGSRNVLSFALAHIDHHIAVFQIFDKFRPLVRIRTVVDAVFGFVVFDNVDFNGEGAAVACQFFGGLARVVHLTQQQVFKRDALASLLMVIE